MQKELRGMGLVFGILLMISFLSSQVADALDFPTKPVTLVIPLSAGGAHDLTARAVTSVAVDYLGQPIIIQLKPGGGGAIGTDLVAKAAPDGHTLLFGTPGPNSALPAIEGRSKGPDDLVAVCRINYNSPLVVARPDAPFKTFKEMIDWAKANPGKLIYGVTAVWSSCDMPWKQIRMKTGIVSRDVPHDGGGSLLIALLGGELHAGCQTAAGSIPHIKAGKLRPLAVLDDKRDSDLPNVPTAKEEGVDVMYHSWRGVLAPKNTPRPIIDKLALAFKKMAEDKSVKSMIQKLGDEIQYLGPDEFAKVWRAEYETYKELGKIFKK